MEMADEEALAESEVSACLESCLCLLTGRAPLATPPVNLNPDGTQIKMLCSFGNKKTGNKLHSFLASHNI